MQILFFSILAMIAFAANSVLCRLALAQLDHNGQPVIDPASFTSIRLISAGVTLLFLLMISHFLRQNTAKTQGQTQNQTKYIDARGFLKTLFGHRPDWRAVVSLSVYMVFFSFAYTKLSTGTGALILFAVVQFSMFSVSLMRGEHFSKQSWFGFFIAVGGLIYLLLPGVRAPDLSGAVMMGLAGLGWGGYSLLGKGASDPILNSFHNFLYSIPIGLFFSLLFFAELNYSTIGVLYAILSGAIASAVGYSIWYKILPKIPVNLAAIMQLTVPAIASLGGIVFLGEALTLRLAIATVLTLGGVAIIVLQAKKRS